VKADITRYKHLNPKRMLSVTRYEPTTTFRVVKRARHKSHRVKRPGDNDARHDSLATIRLVNLPVN